MPPPTGNLLFAQRALIAIGLGALILVGLYFLSLVAQVLLVVFAGVLLGVLLNGAARPIYRRTPVPEPLAVLLVCLAILLLLAAIGWLLGPALIEQLAQLTRRIPEAVDSLQHAIARMPWARQMLANMPEPPQALTEQLFDRLTNVFGALFGALVALVIIIFTGVYGAVNPRQYVRIVVRLVPPSRRQRGVEVFVALGRVMRRWLVGRLVDMVVVAVLTMLGLALIGMPLAFSLGLLAGLISFIPYLGPILGALPALLVGFAESPTMALYVLLVNVVVNVLDSYLATPVIERRAVSIPPVYQITAQLVFGTVAGFWGLLLATPLTVAAAVLVEQLYMADVLGEHPTMPGER